MKIFEAVRRSLAAIERDSRRPLTAIMRSFLPSYTLRPAAVARRGAGDPRRGAGAWRPFAGGTDLMVQLAAGTLTHRQFVSVWGSARAETRHRRRGRGDPRRADDVHRCA